MTDEAQAKADLARVHEVSASATKAAVRSVRRRMLATGAAFALGTLGVALLQQMIDRDRTVLRAVLVAALCGLLVAAVYAVAGAEPVRAMRAGGTARALAWVTVPLVAVTMAVGYEIPPAYFIGAAALFGVWALAAARVRP